MGSYPTGQSRPVTPPSPRAREMYSAPNGNNSKTQATGMDTGNDEELESIYHTKLFLEYIKL